MTAALCDPVGFYPIPPRGFSSVISNSTLAFEHGGEIVFHHVWMLHAKRKRVTSKIQSKGWKAWCSMHHTYVSPSITHFSTISYTYLVWERVFHPPPTFIINPFIQHMSLLAVMDFWFLSIYPSFLQNKMYFFLIWGNHVKKEMIICGKIFLSDTFEILLRIYDVFVM